MIIHTLQGAGWEYIPAEQLPRAESDVMVESYVRDPSGITQPLLSRAAAREQSRAFLRSCVPLRASSIVETLSLDFAWINPDNQRIDPRAVVSGIAFPGADANRYGLRKSPRETKKNRPSVPSPKKSKKNWSLRNKLAPIFSNQINCKYSIEYKSNYLINL